MVNVTLTEQMVNAIGAALDMRSKTLVSALVRLKSQPESQDRDFAIDTVRDAIRDTTMSRLTIAEALEEPEYPDDMTFGALFDDDEPRVTTGVYIPYAETESELRFAHGDR